MDILITTPGPVRPIECLRTKNTFFDRNTFRHKNDFYEQELFILRRKIDATISCLQESPGPRKVSILAHFSEMSTGAFCSLTMSRSITPATAYPALLAGNGDVCQRRTEHKAPGVSPPLSRAGPTLLLCQKQPVGWGEGGEPEAGAHSQHWGVISSHCT